MTKILWKYTFTYIIVMAESNDWTQLRKCEASPESKWNSYQEKLQKEAQDRERENRYKLEERERAENYYCSSDRAMVLHEQSDRHKKALRRNRLIEGKRYKIDELRLLCRTNSIPYYNSLKVEDMIDKLLSLEDITIPEL